MKRFVGGPVNERWIFVGDVVAAQTHYGVSESLECIAVLQVQGGVVGNYPQLIGGLAIHLQILNAGQLAGIEFNFELPR